MTYQPYFRIKQKYPLEERLVQFRKLDKWLQERKIEKIPFRMTSFADVEYDFTNDQIVEFALRFL